MSKKRTPKPQPIQEPPVSPSALPALRLEWRSPAELAENPANWRRHPEPQLAALTDVLGEVGWAGACLYNERTGRLIDGHARRKVALEQGAAAVPVLIGNWSEEQERKILATLDPLAAMAETDQAALEVLMRDVQTGSQAITDMLAGLTEGGPALEQKQDEAKAEKDKTENGNEDRLPQRFAVLIECSDESQQAELLERFMGEGLQCKSLIV